MTPSSTFVDDLGNLGILRQYIHDGGHYQEIPDKDGTTGAYFHLNDMPLGFLENSEGTPPVDREDPWQRCRNPKCEGRGGARIPQGTAGLSNRSTRPCSPATVTGANVCTAIRNGGRAYHASDA